MVGGFLPGQNQAHTINGAILNEPLPLYPPRQSGNRQTVIFHRRPLATTRPQRHTARMKKPTPQRPSHHEIASVRDGRDITRGYISGSGYLQPQDSILINQAAGNYERYEALLRDDRVHSALTQRRCAVVAREWNVEPGGTLRRDRLAADYLRETLNHIRWDTVTDKMLYGIFYGYSVAECLYARDGQQVMLDQLRVRNRRRFVFDDELKVRLRTLTDSQGEALPPNKFWTFCAGADNDDEPYGLGLAHQIYWPVWFKKNQTRFWLIALEKWGTPTAVGKYGPNASEDEKATLMQALRAVHSDSAVRVPDSMMIELLQAARTGSIDFEAFYKRMDAAITTILLSQTMTTEDGSSQSQANVHFDVRQEIVESDAHLVDDSFSRQVATWLTGWNFPGAAIPRVGRIMDNPSGLKTLAERDKLITDMGHRLSADYIEKTYGVEVDPSAAAADPIADANPDEPTQAVQLADPHSPQGQLAAQARRAIGPKFEALAGLARAALDEASSLTAYRDWLDQHSNAALPVDDVADSLGLALVVAELRGRADSADNSLSYADDDSVFQPFTEQVTFFRNKLALKTNRWTDLWQEQHDVAFVVAGAARDGLLNDLRTAVDQGISEGTPLATFRQHFDSIVAKHGWSYKGGRDWRTKVIYETNLRTSYAAGRYQQMQDVKALRPYWRYRHSDASENPRANHLAWDGLTLHADDPWWHTHYPPNGWGCQCYVETLSQRDLDRVGKSTPDTAPSLEPQLRQVGQGAAAVHIEVPKGIDPGWAYAPGKTSQLGTAQQRRLLDSDKLAKGIADAGIRETLNLPASRDRLNASWQSWHRASTPGTRANNDVIALGAIAAGIQQQLADTLGRPLQSSLITLRRKELEHFVRPSKQNRNQALSSADLERLPDILAAPAALYRDTRDQALLYIFETDRAGKVGKLVVRPNYKDKMKPGQAPRQSRTSNAIRTAGYISPRNLADPRYKRLTRDGQ